jgi:starch-binding outer membrane protein, SusD/RagB family
MKNTVIILLAAVSIGIFSCEKSFDSPNAPTFYEVIRSQEGLVRIMVGIKHRFAVNSREGNGALFSAITANGFTTHEITIKAGGNQDFGQLFAGGNGVASNNAVLNDLWSNCLLVNHHASIVIDNLQVITDPTLRTNVHRYALLYKAMSIGLMTGFWEKVPVRTGASANFVDTTEALKISVALLDQALKLPDAPTGLILGTEINLRNTINALSARYYMMLGNYDSALVKAAAVTLSPSSPSSRSIFVFNAQNQNPVFRSGLNNVFGYLPTARMGIDTAVFSLAGDTSRLRFYTQNVGAAGTFGYGFWRNDADGVPLYLPGEILLIQAEAYTRKNDLVNGRRYLDLVRTKTAAQDAFGLGAAMTPYAGPLTQEDLLKEIYRNRCVELFLSGLKLSDSRRFRRPGPNDPRPERKRHYFPYPLLERAGNPNTPADPLN